MRVKCNAAHRGVKTGYLQSYKIKYTCMRIKYCILLWCTNVKLRKIWRPRRVTYYEAKEVPSTSRLWGNKISVHWAGLPWPAELLHRLFFANLPWYQSLWGQHGAHLGPTGPMWAPCWPHEPCYLGGCSICQYNISVNCSALRCLWENRQDQRRQIVLVNYTSNVKKRFKQVVTICNQQPFYLETIKFTGFQWAL